MHPAISGFASRQFYEGKVKDGELPLQPRERDEEKGGRESHKEGEREDPARDMGKERERERERDCVCVLTDAGITANDRPTPACIPWPK